MRTAMDIDPALIREAMAATGQSTPEAAIEEALRQVVQVARQRGAGEEIAGPDREVIRAQSKAVADYAATNPEAAVFLEDWGGAGERSLRGNPSASPSLDAKARLVEKQINEQTTEGANSLYKPLITRAEVYKTVIAVLALFATAFAAGRYLG